MSVLAKNEKVLEKGIINRRGLILNLEQTIGSRIAKNELKEMKLIEAFYEMQVKEMSDVVKSNVIDVKNILRRSGTQHMSYANGFVDWSGANGHMVGWRG